MIRTVLRSAYRRVHGALPPRIGEGVSSIVAALTNKPYVHFDERLHRGGKPERGSVTFSLDFELAWAWQYARMDLGEAIAYGLRERAQVPRILRALEEFDIPATWATVGHLFLESCKRDENGLAHPHLTRPEHFESEFWSFRAGDWYQHDPATNVRKDPAWYAPDLIEMLLASGSQQEVACHGFSHMGFGSYCPDAVADAELQECVNVMRPVGLRPGTLVFPGNEPGKLEQVRSHGFRTVRYYPEPWAELTLPVRDEYGLWRTQGSICLELPSATASADKRLSLLKRYIDRAAATRMNVHIWFHPSIPEPQMESLMRPIFRYCAELRERGSMDILTMNSLVDQAEERQKGR